MMEFNRYFTTIDAHVAGEPLRMITGGIPALKGDTLLSKRAYFQENLDHLRKLLLHEPRGHHGMYGCVMLPADCPDADFGVLFMHNEGYSSMCGHGMIAAVTVAIETGLIQLKKDQDRHEIIIDSLAGKIKANAKVQGTTVESVAFESVPSFVYAKDVSITLPGMDITLDIAYGGAFYAIVEAASLGVQVEIDHLPQLRKWGRVIKEQLESKMLIQHPLDPEQQGIYGVIITDIPHNSNAQLRNVTIFADEQIDRSPCGTGTCARLAALYSREKVRIGEKMIHESIIDSQFIGEILGVTQVGEYAAILPSIEGRAFITGMHQFVVDPDDPLSFGFLLK